MSYDIYCCICGNSFIGWKFGPKVQDDGFDICEDERKNIIKKTEWIKNPIVLLTNNQVYKNYFDRPGLYLSFTDGSYLNGYRDDGVFLHNDCYKFIKINYDIKLSYKLLPIIHKDKLPEIPPINIDYGEIKKYWDQYFDYEKIVFDDNTYMLDSPLNSSNKKNINRIKKIINQLKLKEYIRPSPPVSATFYKNDNIKIGNNKKFWFIKNSKWYELKEDVIKKKIIFINDHKLYKSNDILRLNDLPQIGEYYNIPLFVNQCKKIKKKYTMIEFIGTVNTIANLEATYKKYIST
jgi:hypothetical protein